MANATTAVSQLNILRGREHAREGACSIEGVNLKLLGPRVRIGYVANQELDRLLLENFKQGAS